MINFAKQISRNWGLASHKTTVVSIAARDGGLRVRLRASLGVRLRGHLRGEIRLHAGGHALRGGLRSNRLLLTRRITALLRFLKDATKPLESLCFLVKENENRVKIFV